MIRSVRIVNFESHRNTKLDFAPGVNVITGPSDNGKSAVLRALAWVATNRPAGDAHRSHWGGETRVEVTLDDGTIVSRVKSKDENSYYLNGVRLSGMGQDVPQQVAEALDLLPVNAQPQFDPHFLLPPVSPGEVARYLNQTVNLEVIDRAQSNANSAVRSLGASLKIQEEELARCLEELKEMGWVDAAEKDLEEIEKIKAQKSELVAKASRVADLVGGAEEAEKALKAHARTADMVADFERVAKVEKDRAELAKELGVLDELVGRVEDYKVKAGRLAEEIRKTEAEFKRLMPDRCLLCGQAVPK